MMKIKSWLHAYSEITLSMLKNTKGEKGYIFKFNAKWKSEIENRESDTKNYLALIKNAESESKAKEELAVKIAKLRQNCFSGFHKLENDSWTSISLN